MKLLAVVLAAAAVCSAQTTPSPTHAAPATSSSGGQIIFSRSIDANGQTISTPSSLAPVQSPPQMVTASPVEDADRKAITFTDFNMDVHLRAAERHIAVRASVTVRNDGPRPLARIPLQISSSLNWESVRLNTREGQGKDLSFQVATLNSDADHTGQLHEAAIPLSQPLAPGASVQLEVTYSGLIVLSAQRLVAIGAPEDAALHSDWDQIGIFFTGLRGFGNVVWYPVSSVPVVLGDGARLFDEMGEHKLRISGAHFHLRLTVEFPHGQPPTVALINGYSVPLTVTEPNALDETQEVSGVATASLDEVTLGFQAPSLFVAVRNSHPGKNLLAWTLPENDVAIQFWINAETAVTPFLQDWLGQRPRFQLTLLDLPDPQDAAFETGALLATSLHEASSDQLTGILVHALTQSWMQLPRAWLNEGLAHFMGTLWIERQRGRDQALTALEAGRAALAMAEPESPGQSAGQPLAQAISPVYYRTKAAYVLWMLRGLTDDATLSAALQACRSEAEQSAAGHPANSLTSQAVTGNSGNLAASRSFERLLEAANSHRDLSWFFADWIDADKGLPDLTIESVFPSITTAGSWLVAVNLANNGYAAAEVPVTVRSDDKFVTERVLVPARGKATQRLLIQGRPVEVQVNDGTVPETQASIHITRLGQPEANPSSPGSSNSK